MSELGDDHDDRRAAAGAAAAVDLPEGPEVVEGSPEAAGDGAPAGPAGMVEDEPIDALSLLRRLRQSQLTLARLVPGAERILADRSLTFTERTERLTDALKRELWSPERAAAEAHVDLDEWVARTRPTLQRALAECHADDGRAGAVEEVPRIGPRPPTPSEQLDAAIAKTATFEGVPVDVVARAVDAYLGVRLRALADALGLPPDDGVRPQCPAPQGPPRPRKPAGDPK